MIEEVLGSLGLDPDRVWFTDGITPYLVKSAPANARPAQGNRIKDVYQPFASARAPAAR